MSCYVLSVRMRLSRMVTFFFQCRYSSSCLMLLHQKCSVMLPVSNWADWWSNARFRSIIRKKVIGMIICSLVYLIWWTRNICVHDQMLMSPRWVLQNLCSLVAITSKKCIPAEKRGPHDLWLKTITAGMI
ncbi:hypothetical protein RND81_04G070000 [Saponaria officinalis]|uniref:Uncharacterized protein n=1 Tax=Saponaria officinalis TaxID=3572 RepID=A0AAW1LDE3_SAPOF